MRALLKQFQATAVVFLAALALTAASGAKASDSRSTSFNAGWRFQPGDFSAATNANFDDATWRRLDLPHDFSAEGDFSPTNASCTGFLPGGVGWYRKSFTLPDAARGQRVSVEFDGVQRNSDVWLNGVHLGHRPYGYISFEYDLTPHLRFGTETNVLVVRCERENVADSRWYPGTGIYRDVRLTVAPPVHVPLWGVAVTTPRITTNSADVVVKTEVSNESSSNQTVQVSAQILAPDGTVLKETRLEHNVAAGEIFTFAQWQQVPSPRRWTLEAPVLYTAVSRVFIGGKKADEVRTPFGIRDFRFDAQRGFFMNGENLKLKGVCNHHDAGALGAAVPAGVLERHLRLLKEIGVNAIRCSHNPMAPEFYDLCDQIGLLVMDEAFDEWENGKRKWVEGRNHGHANRFGYSADFAEWSERDCADMVRRDRNHPSIILWSIGNEIDYPTDPYVHDVTRAVEGFERDSHAPQMTRLAAVAPKLIAAVKRHDPTRPVTMALANQPATDAIGLARMLDVVGYNYQEEYYAAVHREFPGRILLGSENGKSFEAWRAVTTNDYVAGQFLWTGFDFLGEAGEWPDHGSSAGLFDTRGFLKPEGWQRRAWWSEAPFVHLVAGTTNSTSGTTNSPTRRFRSARAQWNWGNTNEIITVTALSNCKKVKLSLNGKMFGVKKVGADGAATFKVPFQPGVLEAVGLQKNNIAARDELRTAGAAARLQVEMETAPAPSISPGIVHAIISVVDESGVVVPDVEQQVTVKVSGGGRLLAVDNGDLNDPTPLRSATKHPRGGKLLAIIQTDGSGMNPQITASAAGLKDGECIMPSP